MPCLLFISIWIMYTCSNSALYTPMYTPRVHTPVHTPATPTDTHARSSYGVLVIPPAKRAQFLRARSARAVCFSVPSGVARGEARVAPCIPGRRPSAPLGELGRRGPARPGGPLVSALSFFARSTRSRAPRAFLYRYTVHGTVLYSRQQSRLL